VTGAKHELGGIRQWTWTHRRAACAPSCDNHPWPAKYQQKPVEFFLRGLGRRAFEDDPPSPRRRRDRGGLGRRQVYPPKSA